MILLFATPGAPELILILIVVIIAFGGKKIPALMRNVGLGIREFNDAKKKKEPLENGQKEK
jgi:sec-independent protein translocase protein TatA